MRQRNGVKFTVKKIKVEKDYSFRDTIASLVLKCVSNGSSPKVTLPLGENLPSVRVTVVKPDKQEAIRKHQTRML